MESQTGVAPGDEWREQRRERRGERWSTKRGGNIRPRAEWATGARWRTKKGTGRDSWSAAGRHADIFQMLEMLKQTQRSLSVLFLHRLHK